MEKPTFKVPAPYMDYTEMVDYVYEKYKCEGLAKKYKFWQFMLHEAFYDDIDNPCFRTLNLGDVFDKFCDAVDEPSECWEAHILSRMITEFGRDNIRVQISW